MVELAQPSSRDAQYYKGIAAAGNKLPWQHLQYANSPRRRTASNSGRQSQQHTQQQHQQGAPQQGAACEAYSSGNAYTSFIHDYGAAGSDLGSDTWTTKSSPSQRYSDSSCSSGSCSSGHVSIMITQAAAAAAAAKAAAAAASEAPRELELLKGVSGFAVPGKLMALMGGSGAGESQAMIVTGSFLHCTALVVLCSYGSWELVGVQCYRQLTPGTLFLLFFMFYVPH